MLSTKQCALYILLNTTVKIQCSCYCKHHHLLFLNKEIKAQAIKKLAVVHTTIHVASSALGVWGGRVCF